MTRMMTSLTVALSLSCAIALQAQEVKSRTTVKADNAKTVTYTGCVATGTEAQSFILDHVVPIGQTTRTITGTTGSETTTTTTYALIPGEKVEFQQHVGHKVQVTGVLLSGDMKTKTKTTVEREHAPDTTMTEKTKTDDAMPQLRVISVKHLADSCTM